jgi:hypothetical protein
MPNERRWSKDVVNGQVVVDGQAAWAPHFSYVTWL